MDFEYSPNFDVDCNYYEDFDAVDRSNEEKQKTEESTEYFPNSDSDYTSRDVSDSIQSTSSSAEIRTDYESFNYVPNFDVDCDYEEFRQSQNEIKTDLNHEVRQEHSIPKRVSPKKENKTPVNKVPPPILSVHAKFSMKVLKTSAITPIPNYKSMLDEELNDHLSKFGMRPMGRKRAIEELTRIYEATHPVIDETATPTRERIWPVISEYTEQQPKKAIVSRKRPAPPEFDNPTLVADRPQTFESLVSDVLRWLRMPQNSLLYRECLTLQSIQLDRLMDAFAPLLKEKSMSKGVFVRILDNLHITYSEKRAENNHYYY